LAISKPATKQNELNGHRNAAKDSWWPMLDRIDSGAVTIFVLADLLLFLVVVPLFRKRGR
jgi:hypothetical protein